ncbi:MAG: glycerate-2-kinase family protein, partial [Thermoanaerobaculia bacterium]
MGGTGQRQLLRRLYRAALSGVDPAAAVRRALCLPAVGEALAGARRIGVFAAGKAAARMLDGASSVSGERFAVVPRGGRRPRRGVRTLAAGHPEPDRSSVAAARKALAFFARFGREDLVLCLVSGGASSLLCLPRPGLTLSAKRRAVDRLVARGAAIGELNRLRTRLSAVKGGRLARATAARIVTLVLSDVPGDRPALVGSGPTVRGRLRDLTLVVGWNALGVKAAAGQAAALGVSPRIARRPLSGMARAAGAAFARKALDLPPGAALLSGGETTVAIGKRRGRAGRGKRGRRGGRCLEFALGA